MTMTILDDFEVLQRLSKVAGKWGLMLSHAGAQRDNTPEELSKAVPYLDTQSCIELAYGKRVFCLFDTEEECYAAYDQTVGDDGPTKTNPYDGPVRVYGITCTPDGELQNENT